MDNIKVCPYCGGHQFMAHIKRGCLVECTGMDENGEPIFKVLKEGAKNKYELEILRCSSCKHDLAEDDLIGGVPCKNCGKLFAPNSLDENDNCEVCAMLLANPQLQNATQDDLLKLLARAMKGVKPDTTLVSQKQEQAAQVEMELDEGEAPVEETPSAADAILNGGVPSDVVQPKTRKRRTIKRATESAPEAPEPVPSPDQQEIAPEVPVQEQADAVNDVADAQTAPFPDLPGLPNFPAQPAEPSAEVPTVQVGSGFKMFDGGNDEEPF